MLTKQGFFPPNTKSAGSFPYTPAVVVGDQVFISGQGPIDPATGQIKGTSIEEQVELTLRNVERALHCAGATLEDVVKVTVYLSDIGDFDRYNVVYARFFAEPRPARTTLQSTLWGGIFVEIDAIAIKGCGKKAN